ncbi:probable RNA polymerase II nuclear localization protein SLC7A6OS [Entelurus aequoreus]|uniref:probable RNA polymerase II nuclear localization protein SLC7A6OS n=1 Tax=Entelurus aequoreus TaxID=161455 RepID=UPI002B1CEBE4|nr:probable RNA polymerase II nuclear localization protein SLC7A6OS [Entelurus aequoreus]
MEPNATILRVKRKRGTDPADSLLLACKRIRPAETSQGTGEAVPEPGEDEVEKSVFKLVATVATQDAPVQTQVRQALARPRVAHALRPSANSSQRIFGDLRSAKCGVRRDERYRILSSHRAGLSPPAPPRNQRAGDVVEDGGGGKKRDKGLGEIQVVDLVHEDLPEQDKALGKSSDPEVILCNNTKMLRERLSVSTATAEEGQDQDQDDDYVYDLYYQEMVAPGWIQDILSVRAYAEEGELVPDLVTHEEEVYEDEDDENEEGNWRNDYPDEDSDAGSDREERYGGHWEEEHSYSRRSWQRYQGEVLRELSRHGDDDDDTDGSKNDSD